MDILEMTRLGNDVVDTEEAKAIYLFLHNTMYYSDLPESALERVAKDMRIEWNMVKNNYKDIQEYLDEKTEKGDFIEPADFHW